MEKYTRSLSNGNGIKSIFWHHLYVFQGYKFCYFPDSSTLQLPVNYLHFSAGSTNRVQMFSLLHVLISRSCSRQKVSRSLLYNHPMKCLALMFVSTISMFSFSSNKVTDENISSQYQLVCILNKIILVQSSDSTSPQYQFWMF